MLTYQELVALAQSLRDQRVLSVYLDGSVADPKDKHVWRLELDHQLKSIRQNIHGTSHSERELFEDCVRHLDKLLADFHGALGAPGWAGFITGDSAPCAELLPVPMPTLASWRKGVRIAPYVRALKQNRPVIVLVADTRDATMYKYVHGTLEHIADAHARVVTDEPTHMSNAPRPGFHPGVRGTPGKDESQREVVVASKRMIADVAERAVKAAGNDGWILAGGIPEVASHVVGAIAERASDRVRQLASLDIHASEAQIATAAQKGASALRDDFDAQRIAAMIDREQATGLAAFGHAAAERALQQKRVRELYITHRFLEEHTRHAEDAVRDALDQGATVEEVERGAAERLDKHGGIAARLRYRLTVPEPPRAEARVHLYRHWLPNASARCDMKLGSRIGAITVDSPGRYMRFFGDRSDAGAYLAQYLATHPVRDPRVLGLARGGVPRRRRSRP
ncbi:MAG: baeRF10 domain-containing protein [Gemmatimonadaceae bacterium]